MGQVNRLREHLFFVGMAILLSSSVVLGFAKSYFFAGILQAPLRSTAVHIHGIVFSLWFIVFLMQTFLVLLQQVSLHRYLGPISYGVAGLVVLSGVQTATDSLRRHVGIGSFDLQTSYAISMMDMVAFAVLILSSYTVRRHPDAHKRLVLFATLSIMDAAVDRWPYKEVGIGFWAHHWIYFGFLLLPVLYDVSLFKSIHRSTLCSVLFVVVLYVVRVPLGGTHLWADFAAIMESF
jgi:hypothetical protein